MKILLRNSIVLLVAMFCISPVVASTEKGVYRLSIRRNNYFRRELVTVEAPSFSGDIEEIIDEAEEQANQEDIENGGGTDPSSTLAPPSSTQGPNDAGSSCVTSDSEFEYFSYTYEMETLTVFLQDETDVQDNLERTMNTALETELLDCPDDGYNGDSGIVNFEPLPRDTADEQSNCDPEYITDSANTCQVMVGVMQVSLKPDSVLEQVEYVVMTATQEFLNSANIDTVPGLARARYLGPSISNPDEATDGNEPAGDGEPAETVSDSGLSQRLIIYMAMASVGFVAAVGLVTYFRLRRPPREDDVPYVATLENESSGEESPSRMDTSDENSEAHFSSIMPSNYRFDVHDLPYDSSLNTSILGPSSMGTIHEADDVSSDGGIVMSDTGYSTEDSSIGEFPFFESNYAANIAPVLGARSRTNEELETESVPF